MDHRLFLMTALRQVVLGGNILQHELNAAVPDPKVLRGEEQKAYLALSYWADDADIRAKDPAYATVRREGLAQLLQRLGHDAR